MTRSAVSYGPWMTHKSAPARSRGRSPMGARVRTGEDLLGHHTVGEVSDQVHVARYEREALRSAIAACTGWVTKDAAAYGDYVQRAQAHFDKLDPILQSAEHNIANIPPGFTPAQWQVFTEPAYDYEHLIAWRHDLKPLSQEFTDKSGCGPVDYSKQPQPTAADPQLEVYRAADKAAKVVEGAGDALSNRGVYVALGIVAGIAILSWVRK